MVATCQSVRFSSLTQRVHRKMNSSFTQSQLNMLIYDIKKRTSYGTVYQSTKGTVCATTYYKPICYLFCFYITLFREFRDNIRDNIHLILAKKPPPWGGF